MAGQSKSDALTIPRKAVPWLAVLAVLVGSPSVREAVIKFFRRLLVTLRLSNFVRPAVRKDFLNASVARSSAGGFTGGFTGRLTDRPSRHSGPAVTSLAGSSTEGWANTAGPQPDNGQGFFDEFTQVLPTWLSEGLRSGNFHNLKPIQRKVLPLALAGRDVCGIAPTGSGKTLAFLVPGLVHAAGQPPPRGASDGPIMLVLAPTRELAVQINKVAEGLLKPSWQPEYQDSSFGQGKGRGLSCTVVYGGPRRTDQLQTLRFQNSTHLVVATPGRLLDFLEHGAFTLHRVSFFVLDEGDRMLDFGFEPDVTAIAQQIRKDRQMLFFSATWPPEVEQAALKLCSQGQPFEMVSVRREEAEIASDLDGVGERITMPGHGGLSLPPKEIHQVVEVVAGGGSDWGVRGDFERKAPLLLRHLEDALGGIGETPGKALIFTGTRLAAEELGNLVARHFGLERCGVMHGARKQDQREATLQSFRTGRIRALVATDVLGRGVDIPGVTHVVIYDFPQDIETYIHRVGRTGRNGVPGTSIAFFEPRPWFPDLARELVHVLRNCNQEVPPALAREAGPMEEDWGEGWYTGDKEPQEEGQMWARDETQGWRKAPPLEADSPDVATAAELGEWDAGGNRVWGYSANGGQTEQGRFELRSGGKLRTTWGWGEWALLPSVPHCAPPRRAPPTAAAAAAAGTGEAEAAAAAKEVEAAPEWKAKPGARHLSLSWGGCTDVVALDADGLNFELVSRSGRPASTYKKKTIGRALPGVVL